MAGLAQDLTMTGLALRIGLGFLPVLFFSLVLYFLDNYKLVKFRAVLEALLAGCSAAIFCFFLNRWALSLLHFSSVSYARYLAPVVEELAKVIYLVYLFRKKRVGFMVDAAILGFALGAGFALFENITYLYYLTDSNPLYWVIRGFGTAIMHGGNVALIGILAKRLADRRGFERFTFFLPGLGLAITLHSLFNHLLLHLQFLSSFIFLVGLPPLVFFVFGRSEKSLRQWLDTGFSTDLELLEMTRTGTVLKSNLGQYLQSLKDRIPGEILADMLCYLRVFIELSIKAKGILLMSEAGFTVPPDLEVKDKFQELKYLEKSIGLLGKRILSPLLHTSTRDLWQLHMLKKKAAVKKRGAKI